MDGAVDLIEYNKHRYAEERNTLHRKGRIVYVEPNDFSGHFADGTPVTPDYSDYCISFDLCAEVVSRQSVSGVGGVGAEDSQTKTAVLSWTTPLNRDDLDFKNILTEDNFVSFMSGAEADRYLSTYYTDISPVDIRQRNIVEGIGITDVSITYENYYMPVIKMKMVDVRGSAMFGREEATHIDEQIVRDNIYGCFFTQPYPKFRMQIKGFYGQAVTFQLSCSDFRGRFNSQTGNYEVDVTFMGYDFGLVSEVPMTCLMAAPYSGYGGKAYWDSKVNSPEWELTDGHHPMKLKELCENIESAINNGFNGNYMMNTATLKTSLQHRANLAELKKVHDAVIDALGSKRYRYTDNKKACYLFIVDENFDFYNFQTKLDKFYEVLRKFAGKYRTDGVSMLQGDRSVGGQGEIYSIEMDVDDYRTYRREDYPTVSTSNDNTNDKPPITKILGGGDQTDVFRKYLAYCLGSFASADDTDEHVGFFNDGEFDEAYKNDMNEVNNAINAEKERIKKEAKENQNEDKITIARILSGCNDASRGFIPYIGDVFKIIACHMETFMYMMDRCNEKINAQRRNNDRTPQKLGVPGTFNFGNSGGTVNVPAFPKVANANRPNPTNDPNGGGYEETIGWVGDFQGEIEWEEEKLVNALVHGAQKEEYNAEDIEFQLPENTVNFVPVLPIDIRNGRADLCGTLGTEDSVAFYVGLRAAQVFGAFDTDEQIPTKVINTIAKADAINYFKLFDSRLSAKDKVFKPFGSSAYRDRVKEILTCSKNGGNDDHYDYEIARNLKIHGGRYNRQPMYRYVDGMMEYCYTPYESDITSIPVYVDEYRDINKIYTYKHGKDGGYYERKASGRTLETNIAYDSARNSAEFFITTEKHALQLFDEGYSTVTNGEFVVGGKRFYASDIGDTMREGMWNNIDEYACQFDVVAVNAYDTLKTNDPEYVAYDPTKHGVVTKNKETYIDGKQNMFSGRGGYVISIPKSFGDPIYYAQNNAENPDYKKAYVFLSDAIGENITNVAKALCVEKMDDNAQKHGYLEKIPYLYTVYMGAVIWRREYHKLNNKEFLENTLHGMGKRLLWEALPTVYKLEDGTITAELQKEGTNAEPCRYEDVFGSLVFEKSQAEAYKERFEEFVKKYWPTIRKGCELQNAAGGVLYPTDIYEYERAIEELDSIVPRPDPSNYKKEVNDRFRNYFDMYRTYGNVEITDNWPIRNNVALQDMLDAVYTSKCIVGNMAAYSEKTEYQCNIKESDFNQYADTFFNTLSAICATDETYSTAVTRRNGTKNVYTEDERDMRSAVYLMLKQLYDRWLFINNGVEVEVTTNDGKIKKVPWYSVEGYFEPNFRFIDQFYTNIYSRLHINCNILYNILMSDPDTGDKHGKFLMSVLSQLTTKHNCHFFAFPDYLMMRSSKDNLEEYMKDIFTPIPYSKKANIEASNRFIIMYAYKASENASDFNDSGYDGFDIWSEGHEGDILPTFRVSSTNEPLDANISAGEEQTVKRGFDIPSFGVAAMRQNNAIFKDIDVSMNNPKVTEEVINALSRIMERGNGGDRTVFFYGQDIYPLYTGYSYTCTLKMMGNAQIMPLMYFQLTNVPMFRGTYMVYQVQHHMSPGDMSTTVTGMKMSKFAYPFSNGWWIVPDVIFVDDDSERTKVKQDINPEDVNTDSDEAGERSEFLRRVAGSPRVSTRQVRCWDNVTTNIAGISSRPNGMHVLPIERGAEVIDSFRSAAIDMKCCWVTDGEGMRRSGANQDNDTFVGSLIREIEVDVRNPQGQIVTVPMYVNFKLVDDVVEIFDEILDMQDFVGNAIDFRIYPYGSKRPMAYTDDTGTLITSKALPYNTFYCYSKREAQTANGTNTGSLSMHAYGCAIDINPSQNPYRKSDSYINSLLRQGGKNPTYQLYHGHPVVEIFKRHGWGWGGYFGDPMHFSFISYRNGDYLVGT